MRRSIAALSFLVVPGFLLLINSITEAGDKEAVSFKADVFPLIEKYCLPCHAEENFNPSELSMDNYDLLIEGGQSGSPIVKGKPGESLLILKLGPEPPEGDRMPLNSKKKIKEGKAVWMDEAEVKILSAWIDQGAKKN